LCFACACGARLGWLLTTLFGSTALMPMAAADTAPKKKRTLLPLLTVVFLVSYALMTMLIVEQGEAIQQQHNLIQVLQADSMQFWAMKGKALADKASHDRAQAKNAPMTQAPGMHKTPSTQAPQQKSQSHAGKEAKPQVQLPPVPAADLTDQRRVLITL